MVRAEAIIYPRIRAWPYHITASRYCDHLVIKRKSAVGWLRGCLCVCVCVCGRVITWLGIDRWRQRM